MAYPVFRSRHLWRTCVFARSGVPGTKNLPPLKLDGDAVSLSFGEHDRAFSVQRALLIGARRYASRSLNELPSLYCCSRDEGVRTAAVGCGRGALFVGDTGIWAFASLLEGVGVVEVTMRSGGLNISMSVLTPSVLVEVTDTTCSHAFDD